MEVCVTTFLQNVVFTYEACLCSSLVGLAVMILLLPVPAKMSALLEGLF